MVSTHTSPASPAPSVANATKDRFLAYVLERHPFAFGAARQAFERVGPDTRTAEAITLARGPIEKWLEAALAQDLDGVTETTPFMSPWNRYSHALDELFADLRGFFEREAMLVDITDAERKSLLEGMILTRATDNRMKQMFLSGELKYGDLGFQGKGFRSLGQEAIFAAALRLKTGPAFKDAHGVYKGDLCAPLIRDLGVMLAFTDDPILALNAQAAKAAPPLFGKDLHYGDLDQGVLPAAAPLSIASCTIVGMALAAQRRGEQRVALSFIGDGGCSLGEWHEAINFAASKKLPMVFCIQNNQTALSTPVEQQTQARVFADKAAGYGIPGITIDGTDPEAIATTFAWAADRARTGAGPALIEVCAMRMCGHAHHDDMLYLGEDPPLTLDAPKAPTGGYVDAKRFGAWVQRDPIERYSKKLIASGIVSAADVDDMKARATSRVEMAMQYIRGLDWPDAKGAGSGVFTDSVTLAHGTPKAIAPFGPEQLDTPEAKDLSALRVVEDAPAFDRSGQTYLAAVAQGLADVLEVDDEAFILGEDVGAPYGNAFLLLKPLVQQHADRLMNAPIAEGAIIGALVGAALEGQRPIGEMQFNDFVASGFNQLVNNAAKFHYRTGRSLPFTLRMPWGGLRRAGPYHSQDTAPWFFRTFGLKIIAPSTPHDARALMRAAHQDDNPVLYYEHIGLYREPRIKQSLAASAPGSEIALGQAAFRRLGDDLSIITYGAYVHKAMRAAERLAAEHDMQCDVLDLRSLSPLDWARIEASVRHTGRVLLVGEDSKTGSIVESISARIAESLFDALDGPPRVLGALDTPVPYAPSLEDAFLLGEDHLFETARAILNW